MTDEPQQPDYNDPETLKKLRERQSSRAKVMGLGLVALVILFYLITVVKIGMT